MSCLIVKIESAKGKEPCIHGNLCREYWERYKVIYSTFCPVCNYYEPKEKQREGK